MRESWLWPVGAFAALGFAVVSAGLLIYSRTVNPPNPCTVDAGQCYSIQGVYSQLNCPGQHVETVEVNGQSFFLGCYGESSK